jgi:hypothetical protein
VATDSEKITFLKDGKCYCFSPKLSRVNLVHTQLKCIFNILQHVEPLLCNDLEMGGYTRAVSGQRLRKHVPAATNLKETITQLCFLFSPCQGVIRKTIGTTV